MSALSMNELLNCEKERQDKLEKLRGYQEKKIPVVQYGKGEFGNEVKKFLEKEGIRIEDAFVDEKYKTDASDLTLMDCIAKYKKVAVVVCVSSPNVIEERTKEFCNNPDVLDVFFFGHSYPAGRSFLSIDDLKENQDRIEEAFSLWEDELSRETMIAFLKAKLSGNNRKYLEPVAEHSGTEYFNSLFQWEKPEVFVDGGAFNGDTYESFLKNNIDYKKYVAFEPDHNNFNLLKAATENDQKVSVIEKGIFGSVGSLSFQVNSDMSSKFTLENEKKEGILVPVTTIDQEVPDATFIKLDIEGSEYEGLKGAIHTIQQNKPKLAICCYHKIEDIWQLPLYVKELNQDYRLYLRQHENAWTRDLVLYAEVSSSGTK
ncbi:MAG: FkbM family methyltransferase [Clostridiales bacterium]|nr:FkbM family methyltransferase [Clostridiales bacterium]